MKNKKQSSTDLTEALVQSLEPVKRLSSIAFSFWTGVLVSLFFAFIVLFFLAPFRGDLITLLISTPAHIVSFFSILSLGFFGLSSIRARMPGLDFRRPLLWGLSMLGSQILLLATLQLFSQNQIGDFYIYVKSGFSCTQAILTMCFPLIAGFIFFMRRGAVLSERQATWSLLLFAISVAEFALPFSCPNEEPVHLLFSHLIVPMTLLSLVLVPAHHLLFKKV